MRGLRFKHSSHGYSQKLLVFHTVALRHSNRSAAESPMQGQVNVATHGVINIPSTKSMQSASLLQGQYNGMQPLD